MNTSNRRHTLLTLLCLTVVLIPPMGMAQPLTDQEIEQELETKNLEQNASTAYKRGAQTTPDPWTVSSSSALFSRPTFFETFKLSAEVTDGEHNYSLSGSVSEVLGRSNRFLDGLQTLISYSAESQQASVALKWNLSLRDIRFLSHAARQEIFSAGTNDFRSCETALTGRAEPLKTEVFEAELLKCGMAQRDAQTKVLDEALQKRTLMPTFSAGVAAAYGFENERWGKVAGNLSMNLPFTNELALVVNGDFESSPGEDGLRHPNIGGSLALSYTAPILENRVRVDFAGKVLECLDNCGDESSTLQFGPTLGIAFGDDKDSLLGISLNWSGKGKSAGDAFLGLSLTRNVGPL